MYRVSFDLIMEEAIRLVKVRLPSIDSKIFMREHYDRMTGISVVDNKVKHPFSSILMYDSEDIIDDSPLTEAMDRYLVSGVASAFKLSFKDFLNNPKYVNDVLTKKAKSHNETQASLLNELSSELE